jgi:hypothetical protein
MEAKFPEVRFGWIAQQVKCIHMIVHTESQRVSEVLEESDAKI